VYEADKNRIISAIDNFIIALETKILPQFNDIEKEAKEVEKERLKFLSSRFNPDTMDPSDCYEDAYFAGCEHYEIYTEMKQSVLNMSSVWLYHLFEKDCNMIFSDKKWGDRKIKLTNLSIGIVKPSNFYKINEELQYICNINKHGDGKSQAELLKIRPDLFEDKYLSSNKKLKDIDLSQIKDYASEMKSFWMEVYEQLQKKPKKSL